MFKINFVRSSLSFLCVYLTYVRLTYYLFIRSKEKKIILINNLSKDWKTYIYICLTFFLFLINIFNKYTQQIFLHFSIENK